MKLNKIHWLSALTVFALISGFFIHLLISKDDIPANATIQLPNTASLTKIAYHDEQVTALTMKLAELQSHVLRLNALGDRLAEDAGIPDKEFNFKQLPPSGGPMTQYKAKHEEKLKKTVPELLASISTLENILLYEEKQLQMLESVTFGHHIENTRYLSGRPITKGWLSSYFGIRKDPFNGKPSMHKGVDFAGNENADIIATGAGVVSWAGDRHGYGQLIEINHGGGLKTRYGHNKILKVSVGDVVTKGQVIAKMGSTGRSTGPHVHYEVLRNNKAVDPSKYIYRKAKK